MNRGCHHARAQNTCCLLLSLTEEHGEESPTSQLPLEASSNGSTEGGRSWTGVASAAGAQGSIQRCRHHKHSNLLLLGCASVLSSVALGHDLLQLGRLQVSGRVG